MKKLLASSILLLSSAAWSASDSTPNYYMYSPKTGGHEFLAGVTLLSGEQTTTPGNTTTKGSGLGLNLNYAYGISSIGAFYVEQRVYNFKSESSGTSTDIKSLSPTSLGLKGFITDSGPLFFYNVSYTMALIEKRDDSGGLNVINERDMRDHLNLGGGFAMPVGSMLTFGLKADYQMFQDTDIVFSGATVKMKAGAGLEWKAFAQFDMGPKFGLAYGMATVDAYDSVFAGITSAGTKSEFNNIQLYGIWSLGQTDLLFDILKTEPKDKSAYSKYDVYLLTVGAKMNF